MNHGVFHPAAEAEGTCGRPREDHVLAVTWRHGDVKHKLHVALSLAVGGIGSIPSWYTVEYDGPWLLTSASRLMSLCVQEAGAALER